MPVYVCVRFDVCATLCRSMPASCGVRPCVSMCARGRRHNAVLFRCVLEAVGTMPYLVNRCSVCAKDPKKVQLGNQQCRFPFIYKTQISRNLIYPQSLLYYRLAISPLFLSSSHYSFVTLNFSFVTRHYSFVTSTWYRKSSLLRDGCLSHSLGW
jgi:hypothetical protein